MDFYIDIGAAVLLRILREGNQTNRYRRLFLKLFRAIASAYRDDAEFRETLIGPPVQVKVE